MRDDACGEGETFFLRGSIDRSQQATACEATSSRFRVHCDLAHARQIDHHTVIASAESGEAVPSTTYGCQDSRSRSRPDCGLHVTDVSTAGDQGRAAGHHGVPNASRWLVLRIIGTQQIAAELLPQGAVDLVGNFLHVFCAWRLNPSGYDFCLAGSTPSCLIFSQSSSPGQTDARFVVPA
jgi:hypothetical protein